MRDERGKVQVTVMAMAETRSGKFALVTGGGRGLGKAIALSLADMGIGIVLTWHSNGEAADEVVGQIRASGGKAAALQLDVAATASFDGFFDQLQEVLQREFDTTTIDFLINNAGFGQTIPIAQLTEGRLRPLRERSLQGCRVPDPEGIGDDER